ncbi:ethanolaminephosphotransferase 1 [Ixodes scapularis]|uniref:ethanolaminephosphotransferase 1 n=1 Tax=Ixodes scapularis TaxID=6945 RepID=UPI001C38E7BE|nr:ethanolaminephosphotransferase 1 [Ixodes scapularis]
MYVRYLSEEELRGFENYEYTSKDTSPLSNYVMHPFWDQAVKLVPRNVAPNVLTFSGFALTVVNVVLLSTYDYAFYASSDLHPEAPPVPPWVWLVCALNQFLAHTLDGIDGKHARYTGSSGPLGELFDHGLDSWATLFMPVCLYSVFGRAELSCSTWRFFLILCNVHFCFILSHWEKYNTGILYLPWGYDISQMILLSSFVLTYLKSYQFWKFTVLGFGAGECLELMLHGGSFFMTIPMCLYNIHCARVEGRLRQRSLLEVVRPMGSVLALFLLSLAWVLASRDSILEREPRIFYLVLGTVFSNISCRLIISQMTSTRCEAFNLLLLPVAASLAASLYLDVDEALLLKVLAVAVTLAHIHYGVCVVQQMCSHFRIHCFSLKKKPPIE